MSPPSSQPDVSPVLKRSAALPCILLAAVLLSLIFWFPLWTGGGLVGSDIYAYFLPQKAAFADRLRAGQWPLWNNLIGNGYPQLAESQTGVFYPLHLVLYPLLDLNAAYSASVIVHYVLAFLFAAMYARRIGLPIGGAVLAALVYTYGWFPPRVCLEWSIIGGAWLPLALWSVESFLQTRWWRYAFLLTATLTVQMLAGHFMLAFITQLTLAAYIPLRLWLAPHDLPTESQASRTRLGLGLILAAGAAFLVAAVQLLPTWELKLLSQRASVTAEHDPAIGSIPLTYLSQIALPWVWYPSESSIGEALSPGMARTNRVEAHLYFGLIPLAMLLWGLWHWRQTRDRRLAVWIILGLAGLVYATGCLVPFTRHLPGFSFFEGPGRFGIITTLAAGLLAGWGFDCGCAFIRRKFQRPRSSGVTAALIQFLFTAAVFAGTTADLFVVSRFVTYAVLVPNPPTRYLADSALRSYLAGLPQPARIVSEGKNLPSLLGVATLPVYLGLGPAQYSDLETTLPEPWPFRTPPVPEQLDWFRRAGVTHYLSFQPIDRRRWNARLAWEGTDRFLNSALARAAGERLYLYELQGSHGRVAFLDAHPDQTVRVAKYGPSEVVVHADSPSGGRLVLTDLAYPGWFVTVDGNPATDLIVEKMFRAVSLSGGKHTVTWTYRPASFYRGAAISLSTIVILLTVAHVRFWHPWVFESRWR